MRRSLPCTDSTIGYNLKSQGGSSTRHLHHRQRCSLRNVLQWAIMLRDAKAIPLHDGISVARNGEWLSYFSFLSEIRSVCTL